VSKEIQALGSCRRDLLDRVIVLNERHLKRLMAEYVRYYHEDRTHLGLAKDTPAGRPIAIRSAVGSKIQSFPRPGGLHHRSQWRHRSTILHCRH
jgi:putative transposase